jgi:hypothetical protein
MVANGDSREPSPPGAAPGVTWRTAARDDATARSRNRETGKRPRRQETTRVLLCGIPAMGELRLSGQNVRMGSCRGSLAGDGCRGNTDRWIGRQQPA